MPPPMLPQKESPAGQQRRMDELTQERAFVQYDYTTHLTGLPQVKTPLDSGVPAVDLPSLDWLRLVADKVAEIIENRIAAQLEPVALSELARLGAALATTTAHIAAAAVTSGTRADAALVRGVFDVLKALPYGYGSGGTSVPGLAHYDALYKTIKRPALAKDFLDDDVFARLRLDGPNPLVIERVTSGPALQKRFGTLTEAMLTAVSPGDTLKAAIVQGRLYVADYAVLGSLSPSSAGGDLRYVHTPVAVFVVTKNAKALMPVAISLDGKPKSQAAPVLPSDGEKWRIAKTIVQVADANHHELISHLTRTHLLVQPFAMGARRQLGLNHPLRILLLPHFEGTLLINGLAASILVAPGQFVQDLLVGTIDTMLPLAASALHAPSFNDSFLPELLKRRGVDDEKALPSYPYRDDALPLWEAIGEWVSAYVDLYYGKDADVAADYELQAWIYELTAYQGGRMTGVGESTSTPFVRTRGYLKEMLTMIIFTASAQHAAVNFPQWRVMGYVPAMPLGDYAKSTTSAGGPPNAAWLAHLPPLYKAMEQIDVLYLLGNVYDTRLGNYAKGYFTDARVAAPLAAFRSALKSLERDVKDRNKTRPEYWDLLPSLIPQSINI